LAAELELGRARRRRRPLENGGGTTGSTASCDLAIFGTACLRNDADEVGGHPRADGMAWPAGPACATVGACASVHGRVARPGAASA
jgi:hypothetical protein